MKLIPSFDSGTITNRLVSEDNKVEMGTIVSQGEFTLVAKQVGWEQFHLEWHLGDSTEALVMFRGYMVKLIGKLGAKALNTLPETSKNQPCWSDKEFVRKLCDLHDTYCGTKFELFAQMVNENPSLLYFQKKLDLTV